MYLSKVKCRTLQKMDLRLIMENESSTGFEQNLTILPSNYGLHITDAQERFSSAYVKLMCAAAKINYSESKTDNESIDIELIGKGFQGRWKKPRILAQLKCTSNYNYIDMNKQELSFPLPIKNYNDLRGIEDLPKILIVVFCPEDNNEWVQYSALQSNIRFSGYWVSLEKAPEMSNKTSVTVKIPFSQAFNNLTLIELMKQHSARGLMI
ncbi:DUF4365 domain-containing protein [Shewanella livingstonensis]|uniref:DUF4365 domain-containing protein n=2 Tax=Shewanella livingstonensis TaxID=150120 RepID=A0A3G8LSI7_9GAMM|nr:DUF4365 domain-containing protein [Shewanella livingstonensis]